MKKENYCKIKEIAGKKKKKKKKKKKREREREQYYI